MRLTAILTIILVCLCVFVGGCSTAQIPSGPATTGKTVSGLQSLMLNEQDLQQLGLIGGGVDCLTEEQSSIDSLPVQYSFCNYTLSSLNDTTVIIELRKFTSLEDLNGTYQYDSLHLYSAEGLISENDFGDQSRFRLNNVNDYGGQYNEPGVFYYHLWICKDEFLIHITSGGRSKDAKEHVAEIGRRILSKTELLG